MKRCLESLKIFLDQYTNFNDIKNSVARNWTRASDNTTLFFMKEPWLGQNLCSWGRAYINNHKALPTHKYELNIS
ncbi:hypothetical protein BDR06DRAFT_886012 [Suillus hirtellus]|nr:hypothetical protein BDR06DRAFT_886012 [Suillus hirtellus]